MTEFMEHANAKRFKITSCLRKTTTVSCVKYTTI